MCFNTDGKIRWSGVFIQDYHIIIWACIIQLKYSCPSFYPRKFYLPWHKKNVSYIGEPVPNIFSNAFVLTQQSDSDPDADAK